MPRSQPPTGKVASVADRIRGAVMLALTVGCLVTAANVQDAQWQITFGFAGLVYFITLGAMMCEHVDCFEK